MSAEVTSLSKCQNPFFPCRNTQPQLNIIADIQVKCQKYPVCQECWAKIADSDEYTWESAQPPENTPGKLEPDWSTTLNPGSEQKEE
jgi:hypothetical protein